MQVAVICQDEDIATGFSLVGISAQCVYSTQELSTAFEAATRQKEIGVLLIEDPLLLSLSAAQLERESPIIIAI